MDEFKLADNAIKDNYFKAPAERNKAVLMILFVLGAALRIYNLAKYSFWFDEAFSALQACAPLRIISKHDFSAPAYPFFLAIWSRVFNTESALRFSSVIFGSASILLIYFLGAKLFSRKTGLWGAFLLALSPFNIYYSQELRMYSLVVFLSLLSAIFLLESLEKDKWYCWLGYVVFNVLNIYTQYIGLFLLAAEILYYYITGQRKRRWLWSNLAIILLFIPWAVVVVLQYINMLSSPGVYIWFHWYEPVSLYTLLMTFKNFSIGYNASRAAYVLSAAVFFILFITAIIKERGNKQMLFCVLGLFLPVMAIFLISKLKPMYADRYFIASSAFYYLIIARAISEFKHKEAVFAVIILLAVVSGLAIGNFYKNILPVDYHECLGAERKKDHRNVAAYIQNNRLAGEEVYHVWNNTVYPFLYYSNKGGERNKFCRNTDALWENGRDYGKVLAINKNNNNLEITKLGIDGTCFPVAGKVLDKKNGRFWVIVSFWDLGVYPEKEHWEIGIVKRLDKDYARLNYKVFDGAVVCLYGKR